MTECRRAESGHRIRIKSILPKEGRGRAQCCVPEPLPPSPAYGGATALAGTCLWDRKQRPCTAAVTRVSPSLCEATELTH